MGSVTLNEAARYRFDSPRATLEIGTIGHSGDFVSDGRRPGVHANMRAPPLSFREFMA
jgi:hypothetical protein